jgi:hypothetical protein
LPPKNLIALNYFFSDLYTLGLKTEKMCPISKSYDKKICKQVISPFAAANFKRHTFYVDTATLTSDMSSFCGKYGNMSQEE